MRHIFYMLLACLFMLSQQINAQQNTTDSIQSYSLTEAVIVSLKEDRNLSKMAMSLTPINTRTNISLETLDNLKDISSIVPNFFMPDYGSKLTSPVYIRGIGSRINAPSVGLYVDNIPYFEKAAFDFNFFDIDNITVFKGPQGTLYGRNTMGGLISITSLSPRKYQGTRVAVSGGNYEHINASLSHYGSLSEKTTFSLSGNYNHSGGYFTNTYTGDKVDVLNSGSLKARLCHQLSANVRAEIFAQYEHSKQGGYPYALLAKDGSSSDISYDEYSSYRRDLLSTGLLFEIKSKYFDINITTAYQYLDDKQNIDQDFTPSPDVVATQKQEHHMLSQEFVIKSNTLTNYQWLAGAFGFYQNFDNDVTVLCSEEFSQKARMPLFTGKNSVIPTHGVAFFHQSTLNNLFIKGLTAEAGIRFDYEKTNFDFLEDRMFSNKPDTSISNNFRLDFWEVLPKFSLKYETTPTSIVYGLIAKGYKTGGFNTSFNTDNDKTFDPENSWNYEVGYKNRIANYHIDASVFYIDWRKQQIYQPVSTGGSMLKNAGHSVSKGFELSVNSYFFNNLLNVSGAYGYTYARFIDYKNGKQVYDDNYIPYVPKHTVRVAANYTIHFHTNSFIRSIILHLDYLGAGRLYWDDANLYSQDYYSTLNSKILFKRGNVEFAFWGRNITNTKYHAFYFQSMGNALAQKGKPFLFGVDLFFKF